MGRAVIVMLLLAGCGGDSLKAAGEVCSASTECEAGLVCDFGQSPHVCAMMSTMPPDAPPDLPDGPRVDAPPGTPDAPVDAAIDAPVDAAIDAPVDAAPTIDAP